MNDEPGKTSEEIRAEIEQTRNRMSERLDTIQDRLSPDHLKLQAQTVVHEAVRESTDALMHYVSTNVQQVGDTLVDAVKRNPLPTALIGLGVGWLIVNSLRKQGQNQYRDDERYLYTGSLGERYRGQPPATELAYYTGQPVSPRRQSPSSSSTLEMQYSANYEPADLDRMEQLYTEPVLSSSYDANAGRFDEWTTQQSNHAQGMGRDLQQTLEENPVPFALAALAIGVTIGLALPATQPERQLMGDARDRVVDRAQTLVSNAAQRVEQVAAEVAPQFEAVAGQAAEDVAQIGKHAAEPLKQRIRDAATKVEEMVERLEDQPQAKSNVAVYE
jgi:hypothetical protein